MNIDILISDVIDSRLSDIAIAKKCITRSRGDLERQHLTQSAILTIYASLEGGIKDIIGVFLKNIDTSSHSIQDFKPCYAMLVLSKACKLEQTILDHQKQVKAILEIINAILDKPILPNSIDIESNLTPKVLKKICSLLDIPFIISHQSDENDLNILLRFRNNIAHGDRKMPIDMNRIDQLSNIAVKILCKIGSIVSEANKNRAWLKRP